ncbi:unnamed protein product [Caretta caretta]
MWGSLTRFVRVGQCQLAVEELAEVTARENWSRDNKKFPVHVLHTSISSNAPSLTPRSACTNMSPGILACLPCPANMSQAPSPSFACSLQHG